MKLIIIANHYFVTKIALLKVNSKNAKIRILIKEKKKNPSLEQITTFSLMILIKIYVHLFFHGRIPYFNYINQAKTTHINHEQRLSINGTAVVIFLNQL